MYDIINLINEAIVIYIRCHNGEEVLIMLESTSKLMYYPTDQHEVYRMLGIVGRISMSVKARDEVRELLGEDVYFNILESAIHNYHSNFPTSVYHFFLERKEYALLYKYFEVDIGFSCNQTITVFDPFAGEANWLEMFKESIPKDPYDSSTIHLIANELESNRYNTIKKKGLVDEHYNKAYEELNEIPKRSVSMLLFNPPYGETNGVRNVQHYLKMIIEDELIYKTNDSSDSGKMILVIRKDDLLESLPLLTKHFNVDPERIYKTNEDEYKKYKQYVVYTTIKRNPVDTKNVNGAIKHKSEIEKLSKIINSKPEFNIGMYNTNSMRPPAVPYERLKENHKVLEMEDFEISVSNGDSWNWIKEMTEIRNMENEQILKPTPLKTGEVANIIASGMIDGEMNLDGSGAGFHVVAGGTKEQMQQEIVQEKNRQGVLENKTKTLLYSQPYLNILINDNGKVKIKELQGGTELE